MVLEQCTRGAPCAGDNLETLAALAADALFRALAIPWGVSVWDAHLAVFLVLHTQTGAFPAAVFGMPCD